MSGRGRRVMGGRKGYGRAEGLCFATGDGRGGNCVGGSNESGNHVGLAL